MRFVFLALLLMCVSVRALAGCATPTSSAADKAALGEEIRGVIGSTSSYTEVHKGTNELATSKTIKIGVNFANPFNSTFSSGTLKATLKKICVAGSKIVITTSLGNVTLAKSGKHVSVGTFVGTYYVLPTSQVVKKTSELKDDLKKIVPDKRSDTDTTIMS